MLGVVEGSEERRAASPVSHRERLVLVPFDLLPSKSRGPGGAGHDAPCSTEQSTATCEVEVNENKSGKQTRDPNETG